MAHWAKISRDGSAMVRTVELEGAVVGSIGVLEKCGFVNVDRVEIAGEPVFELVFRLQGP